ncbi:MAG: DUF2721 domain-containing protein [Opitutaceae bacterium]|nr:DUF2721 domain-containing protein [Opitutaceae bacterium]
MQLSDLVSILQAAVSPVVLISGVGLLVLSMTNRLARVVDRSRQLGAARRGNSGGERTTVDAQLSILIRRARLLRRAIRSSTWCVLMAAVLVIELFLSAFLRFDGTLISALLFVSCLVFLIVALVSFLQDINLSLVALDLELEASGRSDA